MKIKKEKCFFCPNKIDVRYMEKEICVDGSTWFSTMDWPIVSNNYIIVEGYDCCPVVVCNQCKNKIEVGKCRAPNHPFARVKIL